jgi:hypothetical protein
MLSSSRLNFHQNSPQNQKFLVFYFLSTLMGRFDELVTFLNQRIS